MPTTAERGVCEPALKPPRRWAGSRGTGQGPNRTREIRPSGIIGGPREPWLMVELCTHPATERAGLGTLRLRASAPEFYPNSRIAKARGAEVSHSEQDWRKRRSLGQKPPRARSDKPTVARRTAELHTIRGRPLTKAPATTPCCNPRRTVKRLARISQCAVKRHRSSAGVIPAWQLSLLPVAIGAVVEVTKQLKPPVQRVARRLGERAGRNASKR